MDTTQETTQIAAELNKLPKPTSFDSLYILAQQAFEAGFRSMTVNELVVYLSKNLPDDLTRSEFIYEKFAPGSALPDPGREASVFLGAGTYTVPGGGASLVLTENFNVVSWDGEKWVKVLEVPVEVPEPDLSGVPTKEEIGINTIPAGTNLLAHLQGSDFNDTSLWQTGYFSSSTGNIIASDTWRVSKDKVRAYPGLYDFHIRFSGNAGALVFNEAGSIIKIITNPDTTQPISNSFQDTLPEGTHSVRISLDVSGGGALPTSQIKMATTTQVEVIGDDVFTTPSKLNASIQEAKDEIKVDVAETLDKFGMRIIPIGTEFLSELINSQLTDTEIWGTGFLIYSTGNIQDTSSTTWKYTKKYYPIPEGGLYQLAARFSGNAGAILYDENFNKVAGIQNTVGSSFNRQENFISSARYFRMSYNGTQAQLSALSLKNLEEKYQNSQSQDVSNGVSLTNTTIPVSGNAVASVIINSYKLQHPAKLRTPIVSFISDDGRWGNDEWLIPIYKNKNVKGTFAIVPGWFDAPGPGDQFNRERVKELYDMGHDIAGHTDMHRSMITVYNGGIDVYEGGVPVLGAIALERDLMLCKTKLMALGIDCPMFVAPFGERNTAIDIILRRHFKVNFISGITGKTVEGGTCTNLPPLDRYFLNRVSFDSFPTSDLRIGYLKQAVDVCLDTNGWLLFAIHPQYPEYSPTANPSGYMARRGELIELIDYVQSKGIPILTAKKAYEIWKNPVDIGNVRLDPRYYALGMDGTEAGNYFG